MPLLDLSSGVLARVFEVSASWTGSRTSWINLESSNQNISRAASTSHAARSYTLQLRTTAAFVARRSSAIGRPFPLPML